MITLSVPEIFSAHFSNFKKLFAATFFILISFASFVAKAQAPDWEWAKSAGVNNYSEDGQGITVDAAGNMYVVGTFKGASITFGSTTLINPAVNSCNLFLVKYDPAGNVLWAKSAGGNADDFVYSVSTDPAGNVFVTGTFRSPSLIFGSTTLINSSFVTDLFIAKYDGSGNVLWAKSAGGYDNDGAVSVSTDASGNCFVTGYFCSPSITFDSIVLTNADTSGITSDVFIVKYNSAGNAVWAKRAGGADFDAGASIVTDGSGTSYITGYFNSLSITFGSTVLINAVSNGSSSDLFIAKFDAPGNPLWANKAGGNSSDFPQDISIDASGNSFITGRFFSPTLIFGSALVTNFDNSGNSADIFLAKYDASGTLLWAKWIGGPFVDIGTSVSVDASGNCYLGGYFFGATISFGSDTLTNSGSSSTDLFLAKYDAAGNITWIKGGSGTGAEYLYATATDTAGNTYVTGFFSSPSVPFDQDTLIFSGGTGFDMFVAKLDNTVTGISSIAAAGNIFSIFPNPSNGVFTIENNSHENFNVEIFNSLGQEVYRSENVNEQKIQIDLSNKLSGIYFARIISEGKVYTETIVKD